MTRRRKHKMEGEEEEDIVGSRKGIKVGVE
jgi:hypothetical protein